MKKENNNQKKETVLSEAGEGLNRVRLIQTTSEEEEETCQWSEVDEFSGRSVVAGYRYGTSGDTSNNNHPWIAYSIDGGVTWTKSTTTSDEGQAHGELHALAYGGGRFVVAGYRYGTDNYHPWIAYSKDGGKTWTKSDTTSDEDQAHGELHALAYGGGRFVVAGFRYGGSGSSLSDYYHPWIAYSTNGGETWTKSDTTSDEDQAHGELQALTYGGGRFVVAGFRYGTIASDEDYHPWIAYSTDGGETWTKSDTTNDENQVHGELHALAYGGGRFVVAGFRYGTSSSSGGTTDNYHPWIAYSMDGGVTWTKSTTTSDEGQAHGQLYALTYGGGRFVVAGYRYSTSANDIPNNYHPWIAYSTDGGVTWTKSTTTSDEGQAHGRLQALTYGGGRFVVAGFSYSSSSSTSDLYHPWIAYSTDGGVTWTKSKTTSGEGQEYGRLYALTYGPDSYCWKWSEEKKEKEEEKEN